MKSYFAIVFIWSIAMTSSAASVTIDFESFSAPESISAGTDLGGVSFNENLSVRRITTGDFPPFITNYAVRLEPFGGSVSGTFTAETVDFISVLAGDTGGDTDTVQLDAFDINGNLVSSDNFTATAGQILSVSGAGITSFALVNVEGGFVFDNFTFNTEKIAPIPIPAAAWLLTSGLLGLVGVARRKKS
jgi:hypothetical protein